jgi:hypothetical protein
MSGPPPVPTKRLATVKKPEAAAEPIPAPAAPAYAPVAAAAVDLVGVSAAMDSMSLPPPPAFLGFAKTFPSDVIRGSVAATHYTCAR